MEAIDGVQQDLERYNRALDYYIAHYEEPLQAYPESWVAIYGERVVGADPDHGHLVQDLRRRGIPPNYSFIEFVSAEPIEFVLGDLLFV
jgi:hypothetical protein